MGASNGKMEPKIGSLSVDETLQLRTTFLQISKSDGTEKHHICSYTKFQGHCENYLDDWLAKKITDKLATKKGNELIIHLNDFQLFVAAMLKGTPEERFDTIWTLLVEDNSMNDKEKSFQADEIHKYTRSIIESYIKCTKESPLAKSWANVKPLSSDSVYDLSIYLLQDLFHSGVDEKTLINLSIVDPKNMKDQNGSTKKYSMEQVIKALSQNSLFLNIHSSVFSECFGCERAVYFVKDIIPFCLHVSTALTPVEFSVLDLPRVMFLNAHLPADYKKKWKHLFSTSKHGESFSKLLGLIQDKGPTLLILKDNGGKIFGALASESWSLNPKFYGNEKSFLFHLSPRFVIYSSTGYNKNFQYLNIQQKTLPNGLGFGGTLEYFGIWIDSEFGKGKASPTCTTFCSPLMSTSQEFEIDHLEVWGVGEPPQKEEGVRDQSILDKDPEAKAMLEMMGRHQVSDGQRDLPKDNIDVMDS